jgi:hypothetical protein
MAPFWRENELVHTLKKEVKRSSWLGERRCKLGSKARSNSRIQFVSNASKLVPRNLDLKCWSCGPWYNFLGFLLFNLRRPLGVPSSTYRRRLEDSPMLEQNFVNTRPTITIRMSSLDTNQKIQLCLGINDMFNDNARSGDTKTMSHGVFYFKYLNTSCSLTSKTRKWHFFSDIHIGFFSKTQIPTQPFTNQNPPPTPINELKLV